MNTPILYIIVGLIVLGLLIAVLAFMMKNKNKRPPDYHSFFWIGIVWIIIGIPLDMYPLSVLGLFFAIIGLVHKDKWEENRRTWGDLSKEEKKFKSIIIGILGVLVLAGLAAFLLTERAVELTDENISVSTEETATIPDDPLSSLCMDEPTGTAIGRDVYPIAPQYKNLEFLGQVFTAQDCGTERLSQIDGVKGDQYIMGSTIWLSADPTQGLVDAFTTIGFECAEEAETEGCKKWRLDDSVSIESLVLLEPFVEEMQADDCVRCG